MVHCQQHEGCRSRRGEAIEQRTMCIVGRMLLRNHYGRRHVLLYDVWKIEWYKSVWFHQPDSLLLS